jgi:hypothetical protein
MDEEPSVALTVKVELYVLPASNLPQNPPHLHLVQLLPLESHPHQRTILNHVRRSKEPK